MNLQIAEDFDKKLAEIYSSQVTVNLENQSKITPNEVLDSMELIAINRKAMINFRIAR